MMLFWSVFGLLTLIAFFSITDIDEIGKRAFTLIGILALILLAGLRAPDATRDTLGYIQAFEEIPPIFQWLFGGFDFDLSSLGMEFGYLAYGAMVKVFTDNYTVLFLAVALFSVGIASYNYFKYSPYVGLTLLVFYAHTFLYRDMMQIRTAMAAALGLFLIGQIYQRRYFASVRTIFIAVLFHTAALSYFVVLLASWFEVTKKRVVVLTLAGIFFGLIGLGNYVIAFFPSSLGYLSYKIAAYSQSAYGDAYFVFGITNIKNIFIVIVTLLLWDKLENRVKFFKVLVLFLALGTFWRLAFSDFGIFASRISAFYNVVQVILIPCFILPFRQKLLPFLTIVLYAFLLLYLNLYFIQIFPHYHTVL